MVLPVFLAGPIFRRVVSVRVALTPLHIAALNAEELDRSLGRHASAYARELAVRIESRVTRTPMIRALPNVRRYMIFDVHEITGPDPLKNGRRHL